jgi:hypothetical protein
MGVKWYEVCQVTLPYWRKILQFVHKVMDLKYVINFLQKIKNNVMLIYIYTIKLVEALCYKPEGRGFDSL